MTKRQSLKLLGEILLDRANFNVMTKYIANEANLKMMMNLLRDKSKNIQFEAFHVFKVSLLPPTSENMSYSMFSPVSRCSSQIPKSHHKLRLFYGEIRINCWIFWKLFTMTKRVRMLISHFWFWIYTSCTFIFIFLWFLFPPFFTCSNSWPFPVDEQFSDEKQFLIVQIQNL